MISKHYEARLFNTAFSTWVRFHARQLVRRARERGGARVRRWWLLRVFFNQWTDLVCKYRERRTLVGIAQKRQRTVNGASRAAAGAPRARSHVWSVE